MVVMMAFLQDGAGVARPGLSILECPTKQFEEFLDMKEIESKSSKTQ